METDTIAAISTSVNNGGISIIRMSGRDALSIIHKVFCPKKKKDLLKVKTHTIHYGYILDKNIAVDEVLVSIMKAPNTYTTEDIVEVNCHGGILVTRTILELLIKNGARPAEPGEFTKRAFLNGRIDLSQAEAVNDIIRSKNEYALKSSVNQLKGKVKNKIQQIRSELLHDIAFIEAALDDPEHISLDGFSETLYKHIEQNNRQLDQLLKSADYGRLLTEGIRTVIIGKPNAGKSSLLNVLVGQERAIVTEIEGTTRDTLEESINLGGILLTIIDTAGIRNTENKIEKIGIEKAKKYAKEADLIIYVMDASKEIDENDKVIFELIQEKKAIILLNKMDLGMVLSEEMIKGLTDKKIIPISAKEEIGIEKVEERIKEMFFEGEIVFNDEVYITNVRHKAILEESIKGFTQVKEAIENGLPEDFYTIDLMNVYKELGKMIGESVDEDLINTIFAEFCMGK